MGKKHKQAMRYIGMKREKTPEKVFSLQAPRILRMDWYLSNWFEKLLFVLGFFSLIYLIFKLLFTGSL